MNVSTVSVLMAGRYKLDVTYDALFRTAQAAKAAAKKTSDAGAASALEQKLVQELRKTNSFRGQPRLIANVEKADVIGGLWLVIGRVSCAARPPHRRHDASFSCRSLSCLAIPVDKSWTA